MKCPIIEQWIKEGKLRSMPMKELGSHWHTCKICVANLQAIKKLSKQTRTEVGQCRG